MMGQVLVHWDPTIGDAHDDPIEVNPCLFWVNYVNLNFTSKLVSQGVWVQSNKIVRVDMPVSEHFLGG
jgi:hypothetical protein